MNKNTMMQIMVRLTSNNDMRERYYCNDRIHCKKIDISA